MADDAKSYADELIDGLVVEEKEVSDEERKYKIRHDDEAGFDNSDSQAETPEPGDGNSTLCLKIH